MLSRSVEKSEFASDDGRCWKDDTRYRWKSSVPADRGMGFCCAARSFVVCVDSRARVSEMVVSGVVARREISDSIAAIGGVINGSDLISSL